MELRSTLVVWLAVVVLVTAALWWITEPRPASWWFYWINAVALATQLALFTWNQFSLHHERKQRAAMLEARKS